MALIRSGGKKGFEFFLTDGQIVNIKDISTPSTGSISGDNSLSHTFIGNCKGYSSLASSTTNHVSVVGIKSDGTATQLASSSSPSGPYNVSDYDFFFYTDYQTGGFTVTLTLS